MFISQIAAYRWRGGNYTSHAVLCLSAILHDIDRLANRFCGRVHRPKHRSSVCLCNGRPFRQLARRHRTTGSNACVCEMKQRECFDGADVKYAETSIVHLLNYPFIGLLPVHGYTVGWSGPAQWPDGSAVIFTNGKQTDVLWARHIVSNKLSILIVRRIAWRTMPRRTMEMEIFILPNEADRIWALCEREWKWSNMKND